MRVLHRSEWREWEGEPVTDVAERDKWAQRAIDDPSILSTQGGTSMVFTRRDSEGVIHVYDCTVLRSCFVITDDRAPAGSETDSNG